MFGRSREEQNQQDFAALRAEVDQLATDLRELTGTLHRLGARNIGPASERVREAAARTRKRVRDVFTGPPANPDRLAGVAFGVGFLIGVLLRRRAPQQDRGEE